MHISSNLFLPLVKRRPLVVNSAYSLSLARYYSYPSGVNFLSESIQRDAFFRNILLDQKQ